MYDVLIVLGPFGRRIRHFNRIYHKQDLNFSETSCDRVWGLIGGVVKKRGLVKKVSFSSLEMSTVKKSISAWLDWAKKRRKKVQKVVKKLSKSCQKVVKKLSNILSNLVKRNKKKHEFFFN
jgi:hypothetical protein